MKQSSFRHRVLTIVAAIPTGKLLTYGDVATAAGTPRAARAVGATLRNSAGVDLPWHRVVNAQGRVSGGGDVARPVLQTRLLRGEGHRFDNNGVLDLSAARWDLNEAPVWDDAPWESLDQPPDDFEG